MARHPFIALCSLLVVGSGCALVNSYDGLKDGDRPRVVRATDEAKRRDAASDRGFIVARADTAGAEATRFDSYLIVGLGLAYAPTEDVQVSFITTLPGALNDVVTSFAQFRYVVARSDRIVVALRANIDGIVGAGSETGWSMTAGALVDLYLDPKGALGLHVGVSAGAVDGSAVLGSAVFAGGGYVTWQAGVSWRILTALKVIADAWVPSGATLDSPGTFQPAPFALFGYGLRFFGDSVSVDVGLLAGAGDTELNDGAGAFFVAFSTRL